jgi:hypothetical protein
MSTAPLALAPGDARRPTIGRAVTGALAAGLLFWLFTLATKEFPVVYAQVPWAEDPSDTFVSFSVFLLPLAIGAAGMRLVLCRSSAPLPLARARGVLRAAWLAAGVSAVTVAADWLGLVSAPSRSGGGVVLAAIASLVAVTVAVAVALAGLGRVRLPAPVPAEPDALADAGTLLAVAAVHAGPLRRGGLASARVVDERVAPAVRRHPATAAALVSLLYAAAIASAAAREDGAAPILALVAVVVACGVFAFLVAAGAWLGIVAAAPATTGHRRRLAAAAAGAAAVPVSLAFREAIWRVTSPGAAHGLADLAVLVAVAGISVCAATWAGLAVTHRPA